jgi:hypothetical protein
MLETFPRSDGNLRHLYRLNWPILELPGALIALCFEGCRVANNNPRIERAATIDSTANALYTSK